MRVLVTVRVELLVRTGDMVWYEVVVWWTVDVVTGPRVKVTVLA